MRETDRSTKSPKALPGGSIGNADDAERRLRIGEFSKFISNTLLKNLVSGRTALNHQASKYDAAVLFADVSGFTKLTEKLAEQYGKEQAVGAEHLTFMLSDYFDHLISVVLDHNGDVIKFAGDAMLILFPCEDHALALKRATSCGVAMQRVARDVSARILEQDNVELSLKVAVSYGEIVGLVLGGVLDRWEYAVVSRAISEVGRLGDSARSNDVLISAESLSKIDTSSIITEAVIDDMHNVKQVPDWGLELESNAVQIAPDLETVMRCFVPAAVASRITAGQTDTALLGELRRITVLFINLPQFTSNIDVDQAQAIVTAIQQVCYGQRGSLDKISCDDKGVSVIAGFGVPPMSAEDDPIRAVKAAINVKAHLEPMGLTVSIGVASGPVYCGTLGKKYRCEYTLMGDGVNTAARLMSLAEGGILCDSVTADACDADIEFDSGDLLKLKGKDHVVKTFKPLALKKVKQSDVTSIIGREEELKRLSSVVDSITNADHAKCSVVAGEAGIGKSALLKAFESDFLKKYEGVFMKASASTVQISFYGVWRELLYQLLGFDELSSSADKELYLAGLADASEPVHHEMLPILNGVLGTKLSESEYSKNLTNEVLAENIRFLISEIIRVQSQQRFLVFTIDDAQWMDSASWVLLDSLVRNLANVFFIVVTQPFDDDAPASYERLCRLERTNVISLASLGRQHISTLVCKVLNVSVLPDNILELIMKRAEGHPFYSEILAKDLQERGILRIEEGQCTLAQDINGVQDIELPASIESAIISRLERLTLDQQLTLKTASVIGRQFSIDELHYIYPVDKQRESLQHDVETLSLAGMTQAKANQVDYLFKHLATQKIAYELMLYSQRKKMHREIAQWIELNSNDVAKRSPELALHWHRAEDPEKALTYLGRAILEAYQLFANREVLDYLKKIDELLDENDVSVPNLTRARWKGMGGAAHLAIGNLEESELAFNQALEYLGIRLPSSKLGFASRAIGQILKQLQHRYLPFFDKPVEIERVPDVHLAALVMERQFLVYYFRENMEGLVFSAFAATNLSESTADNTGTLSRSYSTLGNALSGIPLMKISKSYIKRGHDVAKVVEEPGTWAWYYLSGGMCLAQEAKWPEHDAALLKSQEYALAQGDRRRWEEAASVYCIAGLISGDFHPVDTAEHIHQQIYESGFSRGVPQTQSWGYCMWLMSSIMQGQYSTARRVAIRLEALYVEHTGDFEPINTLEAFASFSVLAIKDKDFDRARHYIELGAGIAAQWGRPTTWRSIPCAYLQAEAALRFFGKHKAQHGESCAPIIEEWVKMSLKNVKTHTGLYIIARPKYELLRGWYALILDKPQKAFKHWKKGLQLANRLNMKFDVLVINLSLSNIERSLTVKLELMSEKNLAELSRELNVSDLDWYRNWRS